MSEQALSSRELSKMAAEAEMIPTSYNDLIERQQYGQAIELLMHTLGRQPEIGLFIALAGCYQAAGDLSRAWE